MRRNLIVLLTILACGLTGCKSGQKDGNMENETKLKIETTAGDIVVKLYNETPRHRDNFIKLAKDGTYEGTLFHRVIKDFMIQAREKGFENVDIRSILRDAFFVPETKNIDALFLELQKTKQHIAILIDEYGGFSGIVTMEDIIEEVMGDIDDEYDEEEEEIHDLGDNRYLLDGYMNINDVNEEIGTELTSETSETVGGLIIDILGEIPDEDAHERITVNLDNYEFEVINVKDRRIERVILTVKPEDEGESEEESNEDKDK